MKTLLASALLALAMPLSALAGEQQTMRFYGYAFDLHTNKYLYTEVHEQLVEGDRWLGGTIWYYAADGTLIGRKTMDFTKDPYVPVYQLEQASLGYIEGITDNGDPIQLFRRQHADEPQQGTTVDHIAAMAADSGLHSYIRAHLPELVGGATISFRMAVAGELDTFKFRLKRVGEARFEARDGIKLRLEPNSFLRFLADPIELLYDPKDRKLLEYRGVSNVHDPATGKVFNTRIAYYSQPPPDAPKSLPPLTAP